MIAPHVFFYLFVGGVLGPLVGMFAADSDAVPDGAEVAIGVLVGLLWPLAVIAGSMYGGWLSLCILARSFAALWRHLRPRRSQLPRARAREAGR